MSAPLSCCNPCQSLEVVDVPGSEGDPGVNGQNAFTTVAAPGFNVPPDKIAIAIIPVVSTAWMAVGQAVVVDGPATFIVLSIIGPTTFQATWLDYANDVAAGTAIAAGAKVSPSGTAPSGGAKAGVNSDITALYNLQSVGGTSSLSGIRNSLGLGQTPAAVYASGTAYQLTTTPALLAFGTLSPTYTFPSPNPANGLYLLLARVRIDYNGATFAAVQTVTLKLRQTASISADIANSSAAFKAAIVTTVSHTAMVLELPPVVFSAAQADTIQIWGSVSVLPSAGSIDAEQAEIVIVPIHAP